MGSSASGELKDGETISAKTKARESKKSKVSSGKNKIKGGGGGGGDDDDGTEEDIKQMHLARQKAREAESQVDAQLAAIDNLLGSMGDNDDDDNIAGSSGAGLGNNNNNNNKRPPGKTASSKKKPVNDDDSIGEVSLHSSDYRDEELMQQMRMLDDEMEEEYQQQVTDLEDRIAALRDSALRLLKEENNKPAALEELRKSKELEAELKKLQDAHEVPLAVRIDKEQEEVELLSTEIEAKRQEALAAARSGEKPTALAILAETKTMQAQLKEKTAKLEEMQRERERQLRGQK